MERKRSLWRTGIPVIVESRVMMASISARWGNRPGAARAGAGNATAAKDRNSEAKQAKLEWNIR